MSDTTFDDTTFNDTTTAENTEPAKPAEFDTVNVYNANAGLHGRDGGPYLDEMQSLEHEKVSAAREGVEPNLEKPRPGTGIFTVTEAQLVKIHQPLGVEQISPTVEPIGTAPVLQGVQVPEGTVPDADPGNGEANEGVDGLLKKDAL